MKFSRNNTVKSTLNVGNPILNKYPLVIEELKYNKFQEFETKYREYLEKRMRGPIFISLENDKGTKVYFTKFKLGGYEAWVLLPDSKSPIGFKICFTSSKGPTAMADDILIWLKNQNLL